MKSNFCLVDSVDSFSRKYPSKWWSECPSYVFPLRYYYHFLPASDPPKRWINLSIILSFWFTSNVWLVGLSSVLVYFSLTLRSNSVPFPSMFVKFSLTAPTFVQIFWGYRRSLITDSTLWKLYTWFFHVALSYHIFYCIFLSHIEEKSWQSITFGNGRL